MNDRIEDNPSHKKLKMALGEIEENYSALPLLTLFGANPKDVEELQKAIKPIITDLKKQHPEVLQAPDKFNDYFAEKGWIAHRLINQDLMLRCIEFADEGHIRLGEQELINYFSSDKIEWLIRVLETTKEFWTRLSLIQAAYEDTIAERYHACIPVLLLVIDGIVNDVDKNKGFFADNIDLTARNSIAGHSSGLTVLKEIFNTSRKTTNHEEITMPYRKGILHGRDTNYANKTVASKCWAALFAIEEWVGGVRNGKRKPPREEPKLSDNENINELKATPENHAEIQKKNEETKQKLDKWSPRNIEIGKDIPIKPDSNTLEELTPEREAMLFMENWKNKNYGAIAEQKFFFDDEEINLRQEAGEIREIFQNKILKDYVIKNIKDCAAGTTEVTLSVDVIHKEKEYNKEITLRLLYSGLNREFLIFGDKNGQWKILEKVFYKIDNIE